MTTEDIDEPVATIQAVEDELAEEAAAEETAVADIDVPETTTSEDETIPTDQTGGDTHPQVDAVEEIVVTEIAATV